MSPKATSAPTTSSSLADHNLDDLITVIEQRLTDPTRYRPPIGGNPWPPIWPPVCPPWPPFCPECAARELGAYGLGQIPKAVQSPGAAPFVSTANSMMRAAPSKSFVSVDQIGAELLRALGSWKDRLKGKTLSDKVAGLAANGGGRFDVVSAVNRSALFRGLGLMLFPSLLAGDDDLGDVVETLSKLLTDAGHEVLS